MVDHEKLEDDLETWLSNMRLEDGTLEQTLRCGSEKAHFEHVTLYKCSWCGNPSSILRKCAFSQISLVAKNYISFILTCSLHSICERNF